MTEIFHLCVSATDDLMVSCQYNRWPVWCHVSTTDNRCNVVSVEQIDNPRYMSVQQLGDARYISATDDLCDISVQQMTCAISYQCNRWPVPCHISATDDLCHISVQHMTCAISSDHFSELNVSVQCEPFSVIAVSSHYILTTERTIPLPDSQRYHHAKTDASG